MTLLRDETGTASVEAAVLLPIIALCWGGIFFFFAGYEAKLNAAAQARLTAWVVSDNACKNYAAQDECDMQEEHAGDDWIVAAQKVPFLGGFIGAIFGRSVVIAESLPFDVPGLFGGGEKQARSTYKIMCNIEATSAAKLVKDVFCGMLNTVGLELFCGAAPASNNVCGG